MLMHPHRGAVDHLHIAVVSRCDRAENAVPDAGLAPAHEAIVAGRRRPELLRQRPPRRGDRRRPLYAAQNDHRKPLGKPSLGTQAGPAGHRCRRQQDGPDHLGRHGSGRELPRSSGCRLRAAGKPNFTTSLGRRERRT